jgi:hypothetical protein
VPDCQHAVGDLGRSEQGWVRISGSVERGAGVDAQRRRPCESLHAQASKVSLTGVGHALSGWDLCDDRSCRGLTASPPMPVRQGTMPSRMRCASAVHTTCTPLVAPTWGTCGRRRGRAHSVRRWERTARDLCNSCCWACASLAQARRTHRKPCSLRAACRQHTRARMHAGVPAQPSASQDPSSHRGVSATSPAAAPHSTAAATCCPGPAPCSPGAAPPPPHLHLHVIGRDGPAQRVLGHVQRHRRLLGGAPLPEGRLECQIVAVVGQVAWGLRPRFEAERVSLGVAWKGGRTGGVMPRRRLLRRLQRRRAQACWGRSGPSTSKLPTTRGILC